MIRNYRRLLALVLLISMGSAANAQQPNVIVVFTDDHGYSDLGSQGIKDDLRTPHLDSLAAGGVRFTNGYVSAPQCVPSRAGLLTGMYQNRIGVEANRYPLVGFKKALTIAERLKSAGYVTGMAGKWHLGAPQEIVQHGFDWVYYKNSERPGWSNFDLNGKPTGGKPESTKLYHIDANSKATCAFIEKNHKRPFFFYCAYRAPHVPLDAPEKYLKRFSGKMPRRRRQALAMISAMDDGLGQIVATLRRYHLEEKTLIFFMGDNGAPLKIHKVDAPGGGPGWDGSLNDPLNGEKGMLSEGGIRVPFIASWKGKFSPGLVFEQPVISLDVAATALALAGLPAEPDLDGIDLVPYLIESPEEFPDRVLYWRWVSQAAIRQGKWKYLRGGKYEYLFDLTTDPREKINLIEQNPDVANNLQAKLASWSQTLQPKGIEISSQTQTWNRYFEHYLEGNVEAAPPENEGNKKPALVTSGGWICRGGRIDRNKDTLAVISNSDSRQTAFLTKNQLDLPAGSKVKIRLRTRESGKVGISWREAGQKEFVAANSNGVPFSGDATFQTVELKMDDKSRVIHLRILLPFKSTEIQTIEFMESEDRLLKKWDFRK